MYASLRAPARWGAGCMHFYVLWRARGAGCVHFLCAPAHLGSRMYTFSLAPARPRAGCMHFYVHRRARGAACMQFYLLRRTRGAGCMHFTCSGVPGKHSAPGEQDVCVFTCDFGIRPIECMYFYVGFQHPPHRMYALLRVISASAPQTVCIFPYGSGIRPIECIHFYV